MELSKQERTYIHPSCSFKAKALLLLHSLYEQQLPKSVDCLSMDLVFYFPAIELKWTTRSTRCPIHQAWNLLLSSLSSNGTNIFYKFLSLLFLGRERYWSFKHNTKIIKYALQICNSRILNSGSEKTVMELAVTPLTISQMLIMLKRFCKCVVQN